MQFCASRSVSQTKRSKVLRLRIRIRACRRQMDALGGKLLEGDCLDAFHLPYDHSRNQFGEACCNEFITNSS